MVDTHKNLLVMNDATCVVLIVSPVVINGFLAIVYSFFTGTLGCRLLSFSLDCKLLSLPCIDSSRIELESFLVSIHKRARFEAVVYI